MKYFLIVGGIVLLIVVLIRLQNMLASPIPPVILGEERYVPLGDSYTIGTGIDQENNFPAQLTRDLLAHGVKIRLVANPSNSGWTSQQLIDNELPIFEKSAPTFTTILIGVNDFNRGVPKATFQKNLGIILDRVQAKLANKNNVVVITIPDFSVTPTGKTYGDPKRNSDGVAQFNKIIFTEVAKRNLKVVDIFSLSQQMANDKSLVASDGLHPSAKEYKLWEKMIFPAALNFLKR